MFVRGTRSGSPAVVCLLGGRSVGGPPVGQPRMSAEDRPLSAGPAADQSTPAGPQVRPACVAHWAPPSKAAGAAGAAPAAAAAGAVTGPPDGVLAANQTDRGCSPPLTAGWSPLVESRLRRCRPAPGRPVVRCRSPDVPCAACSAAPRAGVA